MNRVIVTPTMSFKELNEPYLIPVPLVVLTPLLFVLFVLLPLVVLLPPAESVLLVSLVMFESGVPAILHFLYSLTDASISSPSGQASRHSALVVRNESPEHLVHTPDDGHVAHIPYR